MITQRVSHGYIWYIVTDTRRSQVDFLFFHKQLVTWLQTFEPHFFLAYEEVLLEGKRRIFLIFKPEAFSIFFP